MNVFKRTNSESIQYGIAKFYEQDHSTMSLNLKPLCSFPSACSFFFNELCFVMSLGFTVILYCIRPYFYVNFTGSLVLIIIDVYGKA